MLCTSRRVCLRLRSSEPWDELGRPRRGVECCVRPPQGWILGRAENPRVLLFIGSGRTTGRKGGGRPSWETRPPSPSQHLMRTRSGPLRRNSSSPTKYPQVSQENLRNANKSAVSAAPFGVTRSCRNVRARRSRTLDDSGENRQSDLDLLHQPAPAAAITDLIRASADVE